MRVDTGTSVPVRTARSRGVREKGAGHSGIHHRSALRRRAWNRRDPTEPRQRWPWLAGFLVAVAIVGIATGRDAAGTSSLGPATGESATSAVPIGGLDTEGLGTDGAGTLPGLGDPVRDGALEFVVADVHAVSARQCAVVSLTVRNVSDRAVRFDPTLLGLYAADGRPLATEAVAPPDLGVPAELAAGAELDTAVGFLDTGAALPAFVDLRQSVFSPGVRVSAS